MTAAPAHPRRRHPSPPRRCSPPTSAAAGSS